MRLGQLARKLSLRPSEIVSFLAARQIQIDGSFNTRLEVDHVKMAIAHFAPSLLEEVEVELETETEEQVPAEEIQELSAVVTPEIDVSMANETEPPLEKLEVIKAPKIELPGLRVVGKIELPEPKQKKEETEQSTGEPVAGSTEIKTDASGKRYPKKNTRKPEQRRENQPWKNPIALQREQEAKAAEERRIEKARMAKEKRTMAYLSKMKTIERPNRSSKFVNEKPEVVQVEPKKEKMPTSWLGKLWYRISNPS